MRRRWSPTVGMLGSAAIFAGVHLQPEVMPEILLHMAMNILAFVWLFSSRAMAEG